jgi:hypothetical protein
MATVTEIQSNSSNSATQYINQAEGFLNRIADFTSIQGVTASLGTPLMFLGDTLVTTALAELRATKPVAPEFSEITVNAPSAPQFLTVEVGAALNVPDLILNAPTLSLGSAPAALTQQFNKTAPEFRAPAMPDRPTYTLPAVPTFTPLATPEIPAVDLPTFTTAEPVDTISAPTYTFQYSEEEYTSELLEALRAKILNDLENGGYGIETTDETRLWERARERELANASAAMAELARSTEAKGYALPPGVYYALMGEAQKALIENTAAASREVAIKRAELFVQNRQFTIQASQQFEQMYIQYVGFRAERALNAAKSLVELGISVYNSHIAKFNLRLEAYRTAAQVYETKIRASIAKLEVFKTQVEAVKLDAERQRIYSEVYATQIKGIETLINIYRTEVDATRVKADIEKVKLDAFKTEIEAYLAQVQAKDVEFKAYTAQLTGEEAKVRLYDSQVRAHATRVAALKAAADVKVSEAELKVQNNRLLVDKYQAEMQRYITDINANSEKVRAQVSRYQGEISAYSAESEATAQGLRLGTEIQKANIELYYKSFQQALENAKFQFEGNLAASKLGLTAAEAGANIHTNLAVGFANQLAAIASKEE